MLRALAIITLATGGYMLSGYGAGEERPEAPDPVKSLFESRYSQWLAQRMRRPSVSSVFDARRVYENEAFRSLVDLGVPAIPYMMEKFERDHLIGHALYRVTKWHCHIKRIEEAPRQYVWIVEEFPDIQQRGGPPDYGLLWSRWWKELVPSTPKRFARLYEEWKDLRERGKLKEAKDVYNRIVDLGVVALPLMIEKIEQGDTELIRAVSGLTDGRVTEDAKASECVEWWKKNEARWLIPSTPSEKSPGSGSPPGGSSEGAAAHTP